MGCCQLLRDRRHPESGARAGEGSARRLAIGHAAGGGARFHSNLLGSRIRAECAWPRWRGRAPPCVAPLLGRGGAAGPARGAGSGRLRHSDQPRDCATELGPPLGHRPLPQEHRPAALARLPRQCRPRGHGHRRRTRGSATVRRTHSGSGWCAHPRPAAGRALEGFDKRRCTRFGHSRGARSGTLRRGACAHVPATARRGATAVSCG
mmetsp:Transcript_11926/g.39206  ORF Transcript_11926/g.39206 Transcript_11926/m.39206 type:complete len:207 (+) Transcript_11926:309-929(+)